MRQTQVPADWPQKILRCDTPALHGLEWLLSLMLGSFLPKGTPSQAAEFCQPQQDVYCVLSAPSRAFVVCSFSAVPFSRLWVCRTSGEKERLPTGPVFTQQSLGREETHLSVLLSLPYFWAADNSDHSLLWWGCLNSKHEYVRARLPPVTSVTTLYQVLHFSAQVSMLKSVKQQITHIWDVWR